MAEETVLVLDCGGDPKIETQTIVGVDEEGNEVEREIEVEIAPKRKTFERPLTEKEKVQRAKDRAEGEKRLKEEEEKALRIKAARESGRTKLKKVGLTEEEIDALSTPVPPPIPPGG